jgi:hypothetical protein
MSVRRFFITAAVVLCCAASAAAQGVKLEFHEGRVNLSAQNAPLRAILNEWARLGGTKIVNGDRVPGGLVTLELTGIPERQALDILLRSASGYLAGPRQPGMVGQSAYASILILPTSNAPRNVAPPPPQPTFGVPRPIPVLQPPPPDPEEEPITDVLPDDPDDAPPGPQPRGPRGFVPPRAGRPTVPQPFEPGDVEEEQPATPPPAPTANNPFGVVTGSAQPGVITPVPQQQQRPPRPQGDPEP